MDQNIVFQVIDRSQENFENSSWRNSKIVYTLRCVPRNYDVTDVVDVISTMLNCCTIRYARLDLTEDISIEIANAHDGGYYTARPQK